MKYFTIILVIITCFSCTKEDDCGANTGTTSEIPTCLYNYIFNTGSYWVYKDTASVQVDSTYIINIEHDWQNGKSGSGGCGTSSTSVEVIYASYSSSIRSSINESIWSSSINTTYGGYGLCGLTPIDSVTISSGTYYNVLDINLDSVRLFYKEGIGIIRRVEYNPPVDTVTYDLINYQVSLFPVPQ